MKLLTTLALHEGSYSLNSMDFYVFKAVKLTPIWKLRDVLINFQ